MISSVLLGYEQLIHKVTYFNTDNKEVVGDKDHNYHNLDSTVILNRVRWEGGGTPHAS